jgi:hypothetical protein
VLAANADTAAAMIAIRTFISVPSPQNDSLVGILAQRGAYQFLIALR